MTLRECNLCAMAMLGAVCASTALGAAWADSITVGDKAYTNVLVVESRVAYYIQLPDEGRVVVAPKNTVDASTVKKIVDPYYRDELKAIFEARRAGEEPARRSSDVVARFAVPKNMKVASPSEGGGGGGGSGDLGIPMAGLEGFLKQNGYSVQGGGDSFSASSPDGAVKVKASGTAGKMTSLAVDVSVTQDQMAVLQGTMVSLMPIMGQAAPWSIPWMTQNQAALMGGQPLERTEGGVSISVRGGMANGKITMNFSMRSV